MTEKHYITNDQISHTEMLGSQTFNYFCLYAISKKTGHEIAISSAPHLHQGVVLECYDIPFSLFPQNIPHRIYNSTLSHTNTIEEDLFKLDSNYNYVINARFDYSSIYWKNILPELKNVFKIKQKYLEEAKSIISNTTKPIACLNFRRGEYPFYMDTCMDYYKNALELIPSDATIIVLSNDFEWVNNSQELQQLLSGRNILRANFKNYVQLSLITLSDYIVSCPSSFPFIGSVLSQKEHITMYPDLQDHPHLFNMFKGFEYAVDTALQDWIKVKF
jgi:hypothetical protein